jgi:hypothetical protein
MEPLDWKQCLPLAYSSAGLAVAALVGYDKLQGSGSPVTSWGSPTLLAVFVASIVAGLIFSVLAVVRHPKVGRWRYWKALSVSVVIITLILIAVWIQPRFSAFGQGIVLGVGGLLFLEQLGRFYFRRRSRRSAKTVNDSADILDESQQVRVKRIKELLTRIHSVAQGLSHVDVPSVAEWVQRVDIENGALSGDHHQLAVQIAAYINLISEHHIIISSLPDNIQRAEKSLFDVAFKSCNRLLKSYPSPQDKS